MSEQQEIFKVGDRVTPGENYVLGGSPATVTQVHTDVSGPNITLTFDEKKEGLVNRNWRPRMLRRIEGGGPNPAVSENPKAAFGNLKTPTLSVIPSPPLLQVGEVMRRGAEKYGAYNWRESRVNVSTYIDAAMRHLMSYQDGETLDPDDNQSHLAHAAASLFVVMDALAVGNATDDRPKPGVAAEFIAAMAANRSK